MGIRNGGKGEWGGMCQCPNGQKFWVDDNNSYCKSLQCQGGKKLNCFRKKGPWSGKHVICNFKGKRHNVVNWRQKIKQQWEKKWLKDLKFREEWKAKYEHDHEAREEHKKREWMKFWANYQKQRRNERRHNRQEHWKHHKREEHQRFKEHEKEKRENWKHQQ